MVIYLKVNNIFKDCFQYFFGLCKRVHIVFSVYASVDQKKIKILKAILII